MIEGASINVNSLMDGDERAFQGLFVDYYSVLVSFAMKYLDNQEAAEDNSSGFICEDIGDSGKVGRD